MSDKSCSPCFENIDSMDCRKCPEFKSKQEPQPAEWERELNVLLERIITDIDCTDEYNAVKQFISTLLAEKDKEIAELKRRVK